MHRQETSHIRLAQDARGDKKLVSAVTTSNTMSVREVRTAPSVDEFEPMNISSSNDDSSRTVESVKSSFESNVESSTSLSIKTELIVDVRVWAVKVQTVQQRIKKLSKMNSLFIKNTLVQNARGKTNTFSALTNSDAEVNIINRVTTRKMGLSVLNTNIGLSAIHDKAVKTYEIHYIEFQQENEQGRVRYFQNTFLATNIDTRIILDMSWLTMANPNID